MNEVEIKNERMHMYMLYIYVCVCELCREQREVGSYCHIDYVCFNVMGKKSCWLVICEQLLDFLTALPILSFYTLLFKVI